MTRSPSRLGSPFAYAAVGASVLAIPATAAAVGHATSQNGSGGSIKSRVKQSRIQYGHEVVVIGTAPSADRGRTITLQFRSSGTGGWSQVASTQIADDGGFRLVARLKRSGWLEAAIVTTGLTADGSGPAATTSSAGSSSPQHVAVAAAVRVWPRSINELGARTFDIRGVLLPRAGGRRIVLQGERSGRWVTLSWGHTDSSGWFVLRYRPRGTGQDRLRVRFPGDGSNAAIARAAGSVTVYEPSVASWYYDGGTTGCGFHAAYGVANVSLPCGTHVRFYYGGRTVEAVVDDRGPYVGGRTWDLSQNTAAALGFGGVDTVWASR